MPLRDKRLTTTVEHTRSPNAAPLKGGAQRKPGELEGCPPRPSPFPNLLGLAPNRCASPKNRALDKNIKKGYNWGMSKTYGRKYRQEGANWIGRGLALLFLLNTTGGEIPLPTNEPILFSSGIAAAPHTPMQASSPLPPPDPGDPLGLPGALAAGNIRAELAQPNSCQ